MGIRKTLCTLTLLYLKVFNEKHEVIYILLVIPKYEVFMHLVLLSVVSADSLVAHFVTFTYELILQNSSCGNSVQPGLRINSSKSQVPTHVVLD